MKCTKKHEILRFDYDDIPRFEPPKTQLQVVQVVNFL